ncbi:hypothetical protein N7510_005133 [Penicillium lagena]|uniref:uncharacterized protein n=1 Tax=Penicillium lagena TaxID=94218 RepID=UPI002540D241|nr:uncharacterized protein N7510_005133 [Penicillium lagena]KAJ5621149.1 hypothetical protein N7510_005133 [Penicillium lagena]
MRLLNGIPVVAGLVSLALAVPHASTNAQKINVMIQQVKASSEMDIAVVSQETSQVLGYSCSNTLDSGVFADLPIMANVDEDGARTLAIGSKTFFIHEDQSSTLAHVISIAGGTKEGSINMNDLQGLKVPLSGISGHMLSVITLSQESFAT